MRDATYYARQNLLEDLLINLKNHPYHWSWEDHFRKSIINTRSKVVIDLQRGHGRCFIKKPSRVEFGFWQAYQLRRATNRWIRACGKAQANCEDRASCDQISRLVR